MPQLTFSHLESLFTQELPPPFAMIKAGLGQLYALDAIHEATARGFIVEERKDHYFVQPRPMAPSTPASGRQFSSLAELERWSASNRRAAANELLGLLKSHVQLAGFAPSDLGMFVDHMNRASLFHPHALHVELAATSKPIGALLAQWRQGEVFSVALPSGVETVDHLLSRRDGWTLYFRANGSGFSGRVQALYCEPQSTAEALFFKHAMGKVLLEASEPLRQASERMRSAGLSLSPDASEEIRSIAAALEPNAR